jgi:hypothetical protein
LIEIGTSWICCSRFCAVTVIRSRSLASSVVSWAAAGRPVAHSARHSASDSGVGDRRCEREGA